MIYEHLIVEESDDVATITINRPHVLNALSMQTVHELLHAVEQISDGRTARALILTGAGRAFCSGADLNAVDQGSEEGKPDRGAGLETAFNPLLESLRRLPIPLVTAVNGAAAGGGCGYALAGDIVIACKSAFFLQPFAHIGLVPDVGATWLLPRLIGKQRATAMMMLGERISAEQAYEWGMIYQVTEDADLMLTAKSLANRLAHGPTMAYGLMRQGIMDCMELELSEALALERHNQMVAGQTEDHKEGVTAFLEKRPPIFKGR